MKSIYIFLIAGIAVLVSSCATQTASRSSATDDIYFSAGDAETTNSTTPQPTESVDPGEYSTYSSADHSEYRTQSDEFSSEKYYDEEGNSYIVNNYYNEDEFGYDDYYYSSSINRFYAPYSGFGYYAPCYSPWYYDPYFYSPGFNISMSFGWGYNSYGYNPWYNPYGYNPYYGYSPYGYNPYMNGYSQGYWNGYNDGYYGYGYGYPYNDYYGGGGYYNDYSTSGGSGYYYGPNTSTGSNTNTGTVSSITLDKIHERVTPNNEQSDGININSDAQINRGEINSNNTQNSAISKDNSVRVIKYYNAEDSHAGVKNSNDRISKTPEGFEPAGIEMNNSENTNRPIQKETYISPDKNEAPENENTKPV